MTPRARSVAPAWRPILAIVAGVSLLVGACSSSGSSSGSAASSASPGVVQPLVLCADPNVAYFAYTNTGSTPVSIPVGASNQITDASGTALTKRQTAVFAPGEQRSVAAWVPLESEDATATWTITGADGVPHTAVASRQQSGGTPTCDNALPPISPPDTRSAKYSSAIDVTRDAAGHVATAKIAISLSGLPADSPCPAGTYAWTPDPSAIEVYGLGAINGTILPQTDPAVVNLEITDPQAPIANGTKIIGYASARLAADVYDHCHDQSGTTSTAWGASTTLINLSQIDHTVCFGIVDDGGQETVASVDCSLGDQLAETGGVRLR